MRYLTDSEIANILARAEGMQELRRENYISLGFSLTEIMNISLQHGLILIHGNEDTGFEHIRLRHEFYSGKTYWGTGEDDKVCLSYPSKFSPKSIPIIDYVNLADALYKAEFLNSEKNKSQDLFDLYEGKTTAAFAENRKYRLLLYKNTKIIHTLYPTNDKYTMKKPPGFTFHKGGSKVSENAMTGVITITIPYFNNLKEKCYTVVIEYRRMEGKSYMKVVIHRGDKADLKCDYEPITITETISSGFLKMQYDASELKGIEAEIARIENDKNIWMQIP